MARQTNSPNRDPEFRICTSALEQALVGLGQATEGFILSHSRLPGKAVPEDRERNLGCRSNRAIAKGRSMGRAVVGRFRVTAEYSSISLHVYRSRTRTGWAYEVFVQHRGNRNLPLVKLGKRLLARHEFTKHPSRGREGLDD